MCAGHFSSLLKEKVFIKCDNERLEFNFSKFADKHVVKEPISEDIIETLASIADRKSTRLNSSHITRSRMPSSA